MSFPVSPYDQFLKNLIEAGVTDKAHRLNPEKIGIFPALPSLTKEQINKINCILNDPYIVKNSEISLYSLLKFLKNKHKATKIELVGGTVRCLIQRCKAYCTAAFKLMGLEHVVYDELFEGGTRSPPDVDIRYIAPDEAPENIQASIVEFLANHLEESPETTKRTAFAKFFTPKDAKQHFAITSFGKSRNLHQMVELLAVKALSRAKLFEKDDLRLNICDHLENGNIEIYGDEHKGWQALVDILGRVIFVDHPETVNEAGWPMLLSYYSRGYSLANGEAESVLFEKSFSVENNAYQAIKLIEACNNNHHHGDEIAAFALYFHACQFPLTEKIKEDLWNNIRITPFCVDGLRHSEVVTVLQSVGWIHLASCGGSCFLRMNKGKPALYYRIANTEYTLKVPLNENCFKKTFSKRQQELFFELLPKTPINFKNKLPLFPESAKNLALEWINTEGKTRIIAYHLLLAYASVYKEPLDLLAVHFPSTPHAAESFQALISEVFNENPEKAVELMSIFLIVPQELSHFTYQLCDRLKAHAKLDACCNLLKRLENTPERNRYLLSLSHMRISDENLEFIANSIPLFSKEEREEIRGKLQKLGRKKHLEILRDHFLNDPSKLDTLILFDLFKISLSNDSFDEIFLELLKRPLTFEEIQKLQNEYKSRDRQNIPLFFLLLSCLLEFENPTFLEFAKNSLVAVKERTSKEYTDLLLKVHLHYPLNGELSDILEKLPIELYDPVKYLKLLLLQNKNPLDYLKWINLHVKEINKDLKPVLYDALLKAIHDDILTFKYWFCREKKLLDNWLPKNLHPKIFCAIACIQMKDSHRSNIKEYFRIMHPQLQYDIDCHTQCLQILVDCCVPPDEIVKLIYLLYEKDPKLQVMIIPFLLKNLHLTDFVNVFTFFAEKYWISKEKLVCANLTEDQFFTYVDIFFSRVIIFILDIKNYKIIWPTTQKEIVLFHNENFGKNKTFIQTHPTMQPWALLFAISAGEKKLQNIKMTDQKKFLTKVLGACVEKKYPYNISDSFWLLSILQRPVFVNHLDLVQPFIIKLIDSWRDEEPASNRMMRLNIIKALTNFMNFSLENRVQRTDFYIELTEHLFSTILSEDSKELCLEDKIEIVQECTDWLMIAIVNVLCAEDKKRILQIIDKWFVDYAISCIREAATEYGALHKLMRVIIFETQDLFKIKSEHNDIKLLITVVDSIAQEIKKDPFLWEKVKSNVGIVSPTELSKYVYPIFNYNPETMNSWTASALGIATSMIYYLKKQLLSICSRPRKKD